MIPQGQLVQIIAQPLTLHSYSLLTRANDSVVSRTVVGVTLTILSCEPRTVPLIAVSRQTVTGLAGATYALSVPRTWLLICGCV